MPQGLSDQFEPVEHLNRRQHMRRIGALTAPWLDQARLLERRQQRLEQHRLGTRSDEARAELDAAKKALDEGRDPLPSEVQIVVGRNKDGAPTGKNASIRKPEYYARIAELEEEVKKAEAAVEIAERNQRRGSP